MNNKFSTKLKTTATIILILLMASVTLIANVPVKAQNIQSGDSQPLLAGVTPDHFIESFAYLSFRPNPIGLDQIFTVNMWVNPSTTSGRRQMGYTVTITKPDGTKDVITMNSYHADSTAWFEYVADQVGTWTLKFDFPGGYFPAGLVWDPRTSSYLNYTESVYYTPCSDGPYKLTVQQEPVLSWPPSPLPTDYWTRPIEPEHREWWTIAGNYPWRGPGGGPTWDELYPNTNPYWSAQQAFTPWVQGANSAHIAWKLQGADAGIIGGDDGFESWPLGFSGGFYNPPSIVFQGRIYQTVTKPSPTGPSSQTYWQCIDIRTGELQWERPLYPGEAEPTVIEYGYSLGTVPGSLESVSAPLLLSISNGYLRKYDPFTGVMTLNVSIAPLTGSGGTYFMNGHVLGIQDRGAAAGAQRYRLINWTTMGTATNFTQRIVSNTTYARSSLPTLIDWNVGAGATVSGISIEGANVGQLIQGFNLQTGQSLWNNTFDEPPFSGSTAIADHGKVAIFSAYGYYVAYDLLSGKLAWKSETFDHPWGIFAGYNVQSAYGLLYRGTYAGFYAINWETGKIAWKYEAPALSPFESVSTNADGDTSLPFRAPAVVADGKVYVYNMRQSPPKPMGRGWEMHCINATTGEGIWKVMITGSTYNTPLNQMVVSDGYMVLGGVDGYTYVFGKGKSKTTVEAPLTAITLGQTVVLKGTVLDLSPAQPGTACVSKDSMALQMEYLHKQMPIAGIWGNETVTGIPVTLTAIDPNGNVVDIGTTTTNGYYGTFSFAWTPELEGEYEIMASFAGDDSYGSSSAATSIAVSAAPTTTVTPTQTPLTMPPFELYTVGSAIAIIIAIAIVGLLILRILRKRPLK